MKLTFEVVWRTASEELRDAAAQFWNVEGAVRDPAQARLRAEHLLVVVKDEANAIVAVSTAFRDVLHHFGFSMFSMQMFIAKKWRRFGVAQRILVCAWEGLNARFEAGEFPDTLGILLEVANEKAMRICNRAVWRSYGMEFVYAGKSPRGNHLRVWYFKGARIPI